MFKRLFGNHHQQSDIIVVSGLPRSGTSMMMQVLEAGGVPILTDGQRTSDESNPRGYYEFERVKKLPIGDQDWLAGVRGGAVKVISVLLPALPATYHYKVIFMQRHLDEVVASQQAMLREQKPDHQFDYETAGQDAREHLQSIQQWLAKQTHMQTLYIDYHDMIHEPLRFLTSIEIFLDRKLQKPQMAAVIDPQLYRQRNAK